MSNNKLSQFFKSRLNSNNIEENFQTNATSVSGNLKDVIYKTKDFDSLGYEQSGKHGGRLSSFLGLIKLIENIYRKKVYDNEDEQEQNRQQEQIKLSKLEAEKEGKEDIVKQLENGISDNLKEIDNKNKEIESIKQDPSSLLDEKPSRLGFVIGVIIISFMTIYLLLFYTSTAYSALFKEFDVSNASISASIFDGNAIINAYNESELTFGLIIVLPFVFLGLGYLIDVFISNKKDKHRYLKASALILVTFIFDGFMAYKIDSKIHNIIIQNSVGEITKEYGPIDALFSINFWLVIFAGFVVYIIWGILFSFVLESHEKMNIIKYEIKKRRIDIEGLIQANNNLKNKITDINMEIVDYKKQIRASQNFINGNTIRMNWNKLYSSLREFSNGWVRYIQGLHPDNSEERVNEIQSSVDNYIYNHSKQQQTDENN